MTDNPAANDATTLRDESGGDTRKEPVAGALPLLLNVNDDEATRYITTRILQRAGYDVVEAATGGEALDLLQTEPNRVALVVLDVNLPDINGIEVCRRLKAAPATTRLPILHLSAMRIGTADRVQGLESGADGYLTQPVDAPVLIATVRALLRLRDSEAQARHAAQAWETVFGAISDGVCLMDADGRVLRCNPALVRFLHREASAIVGRFWFDLLSETFPGLVLPPKPEVAENGRRPLTEVRVSRPDQPDRWLRLVVELLRTEPDESGLPGAESTFGMIGILTDITASKEANLRQRAFLRDILASVTEGRLLLCSGEEDLPTRLLAVSDAISLSRPTVRTLRASLRAATASLGFPPERGEEMETAVGEAAMNAVVHAKRGVGQVCADNAQHTIQVWIEDRGSGIALDNLHLATLQRGYTTADTLGHGFWMILKTCDRVWLLTGESGTTVVLEQEREIPLPLWTRQAQAAFGV